MKQLPINVVHLLFLSFLKLLLFLVKHFIANRQSLARLINLVAIKTADRALAILPLADVCVSSFASLPNHLAVGAVSTRMPHAILEDAHVLTLVVRPDILALTITHVVLEESRERALIVIVLNASFAVQSAIFIPDTLVRAASDLDNALTDKLTLAGHVVRS